MAIRVKEMPRASLLDDGTYVEMEFKGEAGESITLGFSPDRLDSFTNRAGQLTHAARTRRAAKSGHLSVQATRAVAAVAQAPVGGKVVTVGFRAQNGQIFHYSLDPNEADVLRNQLSGAIADARKQGSQTRQ